MVICSSTAADHPSGPRFGEHATKALLEFLRNGATDNAVGGLWQRQIGALALIAGLILLSQIALQWSLAGQQHDARVIATAARQVTLGERIIKASYRLTGVGSTETRRTAQEELQQALAEFQRAHAGLQHGSDELGLPGTNSIEVVRLFSAIESDYQISVAAAMTVAATSNQMGEFHQAVQRLSEHAPALLSGMNAIVTAYENDAQQRVSRPRWLGVGFALLTLVVLVLVARWVLEPAIRRLRRDVEDNELRATEMETLFSASPSALFEVDANSLVIVRGSDKAKLLLGCPADDFIGHPLSSFFDARLEINKSFLQRLRAGEAFDEQQVLLIDARQNATEGLASMRLCAESKQRQYLIGVTDITKARRDGSGPAATQNP